MKFLICNESETSLCNDCSKEKRCRDCTIIKTDCYSYENGKMYSTCKNVSIKVDV